jgi:hypothetical protein
MLNLKIKTGNAPTAAITIIQGAYETYCAPAPNPVGIDPNFMLWVQFVPVGQVTQIIECVSDPSAETWVKFQGLVSAWHSQRGARASVSQIAMCPAYQSIIGMGQTAVPLILKQLQSEGDDPDQWFWALTAITGAAPEKLEDQGNYVKMAASWFEWAKQSGYAW